MSAILPTVSSTLNVVALVASGLAIEKVKSVGMNDHIAKPINPETMLITMAKWIKKI